MDVRDLTHWSALLLGLTAALWALSTIGAVAALLPLAILFGIIGFALALQLARRPLDGHPGLTLVGAGIGLLTHGAWIIAFIGGTSISFKGEPGARGVNEDPSAVFTGLAAFLGDWLPLLTAIAIVVAFWGAWARRERVAGATGAVLLMLQYLVGFLESPDEVLALVTQVLWFVAFAAVAAAAVWPGLSAEGPAWTKPAKS